MPGTNPSLRGVFRTDLPGRAAYAEGAGIYRIIPEAIAIPADTWDVIHLLKWAAYEGRALVPRGAGSAMGGGNVGPGVVVDLTRLSDVELTVDPATLSARSGAAHSWGALHTAAGAHGLRLPPDPSSGGWATLGGMVSTNAAGARSVRYGSVRPWVRALEVATVDGEVVRLERGKPAPGTCQAVKRFLREAAPAIEESRHLIESRFPSTRKNSSGYALNEYLRTGDLVDLVIGAEGTLGIIVAIEWRLDRVPRAAGALRASLGSLDQLQPAVEALLAHRPSAVEVIDRTFLDLLARESGSEFGGAESILLVEFEGQDAFDLRDRLEQAAVAVRPHALAVETALDDADAQRLWAVRHAASPILARLPESRRSLQIVEDGCVPIARLGDYIRAVREASARHDIEAVLFGHAGDGHLHCNLLPDVTRNGWEERATAVLDDVTAAVVQLGGTVSGEHGDGRLRAPLLARTYGPELLGLFTLVKRAFDPAGVLNPGIKLGDAPSLSNLKVGRHAAELPPRIAAGLRAIEREGAYATPRLQLLD